MPESSTGGMREMASASSLRVLAIAPSVVSPFSTTVPSSLWAAPNSVANRPKPWMSRLNCVRGSLTVLATMSRFRISSGDSSSSSLNDAPRPANPVPTSSVNVWIALRVGGSKTSNASVSSTVGCAWSSGRTAPTPRGLPLWPGLSCTYFAASGDSGRISTIESSLIGWSCLSSLASISAIGAPSSAVPPLTSVTTPTRFPAMRTSRPAASPPASGTVKVTS